MSEGQTNAFDVLENIQVKNRIKELEYDCAELQRKSATQRTVQGTCIKNSRVAQRLPPI